jgi:hypothetical protein
MLLGMPQGSQGETPAIRRDTVGSWQGAAGSWQEAGGGRRANEPTRRQRAGGRRIGSIGQLVEWSIEGSGGTERGAGGSWQLAGGTTEGATLDSAQHEVVKDAGRRSRASRGTEHPGRSAGPKVPDDERKASRRGQPAYGDALAEVDVFDNVPQYSHGCRRAYSSCHLPRPQGQLSRSRARPSRSGKSGNSRMPANRRPS